MNSSISLAAILLFILFLGFIRQEFVSGSPHHLRKSISPDLDYNFENKHHLHRDFDGVINTAEINNLAEEQLRFLYFKNHDYDNNNKLDGCELIKGLLHPHEDDDDEENVINDEPIYDNIQLAEIIDNILEMVDKNNDGFIDYQEFVASQ
ncbi:multiple coagulation factor deficiency protein 2 homolog [Stegodyphus dumicola]|uniref:multiple coagulation factor deficiency protein 2 homolog n=1 Tax=Stegodyphus dumicola TaxID=202533 RepID=UPI0015A8A5F8|nr:multiple coagulation factor deficiency protein 2 homolog [Stegodyphus dumicola]